MGLNTRPALLTEQGRCGIPLTKSGDIHIVSHLSQHDLGFNFRLTHHSTLFSLLDFWHPSGRIYSFTPRESYFQRFHRCGLFKHSGWHPVIISIWRLKYFYYFLMHFWPFFFFAFISLIACYKHNFGSENSIKAHLLTHPPTPQLASENLTFRLVMWFSKDETPNYWKIKS